MSKPRGPRIARFASGDRGVAYMKDIQLTSFQDFGLADPITRALAEERYTTPTPIQAQTIPIALSRRDVVGIAQTGTGKTAAFALPIIHRLFTEPRRPEKKTCRVLVLSPTRELSGQILDSFRAYGRHVRMSSALVIGGVSMGGQVRNLLNGVDVLVATPGRLLDLVKSNALRLNAVEVLVLDEADRMLDMGFIHDIRKIVAKLPAQRQTLFFSATMPQAIADLAAFMLRDPVKVAVAPPASTAEKVEQRIIRVDRTAKPSLLVEVLRQEPIDRALVFTRTKHGADKVVRSLAKAGITAAAIHGNKSQNQRDRVLAAFRKGDVRTLVATDIAARGIDVDGISHVVNYDIPNVPETYVHRIGRTARAGAGGIAISFCDGEEVAFLRDIEKLIRIRLPKTDRRATSRQQQQPAAPGGEVLPVAHTPESHRQPQHAQKRHKHKWRDGGAGGGKPHPHHQHADAANRDQHGHQRPQYAGKHHPHKNQNHSHSHGHQHSDRAGHQPQQHAHHPHARRPDGISDVAFLHRRDRPRRNNNPRPSR
jgi:ATP-dependent RNA helicase RhlE